MLVPRESGFDRLGLLSSDVERGTVSRSDAGSSFLVEKMGVQALGIRFGDEPPQAYVADLPQ